jgi:hypothetical protein
MICGIYFITGGFLSFVSYRQFPSDRVWFVSPSSSSSDL